MGLYDAPRTGRPPRFNAKEEALVMEQIEQEPRQLKKVLATVESLTNKTACVETIKRIAKRKDRVWKRMRTRVAGQPNPTDYETKKKTSDVTSTSR
jgi:hypothetical protein